MSEVKSPKLKPWYFCFRWTSNSSQSPVVELPSSLKSGFLSSPIHFFITLDHPRDRRHPYPFSHYQSCHWTHQCHLIVIVITISSQHHWLWFSHDQKSWSPSKEESWKVISNLYKVELLFWEPWLPSSQSSCLCQGEATGHFDHRHLAPS